MKHIPMRMCAVTREKKPKNELARFVINPENQAFALDSSGKIRSRGVNLSMDLDVYDQGVKRGVFERALDRKISEEEYNAVRNDFEEYIEKFNFRKGKKKVSYRVEGDSVSLS